MRIALFADLHANRHALDACMKHAREQGAERLAFLGDLVGYGADAQSVVATVAREVASGAIAVKGNHDEAVEHRRGYFNDAALAAIDWARKTLEPKEAEFLSSLPLVVREGPICLVHATAAHPDRWDYVDSPGAAMRCLEATDARYTFCGHVHDQVLYFDAGRGRMSAFRPTPGTPIPVRSHRRWLGLVGSVGQPRDRDPAAAYAMFDDAREEMTFFRVPYDAAAAAAAIRASGLPQSLAFRVELGI